MPYYIVILEKNSLDHLVEIHGISLRKLTIERKRKKLFICNNEYEHLLIKSILRFFLSFFSIRHLSIRLFRDLHVCE